MHRKFLLRPHICCLVRSRFSLSPPPSPSKPKYGHGDVHFLACQLKEEDGFKTSHMSNHHFKIHASCNRSFLIPSPGSKDKGVAKDQSDTNLIPTEVNQNIF